MIPFIEKHKRTPPRRAAQMIWCSATWPSHLAQHHGTAPLGTLSQPQHTHTYCLFGALCALVYHLLSLAIHRQHGGSATSTQVQPSMSWMHVKSYLHTQQCAQMTNTLKKKPHTHTDASESSYMLLVRGCYLEAALELPHPSLSTLVIVIVCRHPPFLTNVHSKCVCVHVCVLTGIVVIRRHNVVS